MNLWGPHAARTSDGHLRAWLWAPWWVAGHVTALGVMWERTHSNLWWLPVLLVVVTSLTASFLTKDRWTPRCERAGISRASGPETKQARRAALLDLRARLDERAKHAEAISARLPGPWTVVSDLVDGHDIKKGYRVVTPGGWVVVRDPDGSLTAEVAEWVADHNPQQVMEDLGTFRALLGLVEQMSDGQRWADRGFRD